MSSYSDYGSRAAEIIQSKGRSIAQGQRQSGEIWGSTIANIGQIVGGATQQVIQQRAADKQAKQEADIEAKLSGLFSDGKIPTAGQLINSVGPERGIKIATGLKSLQEIAATSDPKADWAKTQTNLRNTILGINALPESQRGEPYAAARNLMIQKGVIKPEDAPEQYDPAWWTSTLNYGKEAQTPKEKGLERVDTVQDGVAGTQFVEPSADAFYPKPTPAQGADGRNPTEWSMIEAAAKGDPDAIAALALYRKQHPIAASGGGGGGGSLNSNDRALIAAIMKNPGIYATLTPTAKEKLAAELSAQGFTGFKDGGTGKPPTGAQNKVLGFFNRAKQADEDMESVEAEVAKMGTAEQLRMKYGHNVLQSQTGQSYNQAQRAFTEARLRKDSGAAIPDSEFANDRRTYFAEPGDSPAMLAQKNRARKAVLASLAFEAGPALSGFYGEEADALIEDYRTKAKRADAPAAQPAPKKNPFR